MMPVGNSGKMLVPTDLRTKMIPPDRFGSAVPELDRVLGGGFVEGSVVLLAGDPGAGKSTLLLQVAAGLSETRDVLYVSGEENLDQIQLRAQRLGLENAAVQLVASSDAHGIAHLMKTLKRGSLVIIDSLQTMDAGADSSPGSVSQVKAAAALFIPISKNLGITTVLVNHVTKEGGFAGPQLLKHAVDTSLLLQNDVAQGYLRVLRAEKNRFGADDEIGLFDMHENGLHSIENPSDLFVSQRDSTAFGTVIFPSIEGTRPLLLEVQALVSPTTFGTGRRQAIGWDTNRMNMILAMMGPRLGMSFGEFDVYINVAGGLKVTDPGMDLAAIAAIISAHQQRPIKEGIAVFGEVGLAGEVRRVQRMDSRIKEAQTLGFEKIICPELKDDKKKAPDGLMQIDRVARIIKEIDEIFLQTC
jgi:DNA repair protein RadA/Sms